MVRPSTRKRPSLVTLYQRRGTRMIGTCLVLIAGELSDASMHDIHWVDDRTVVMSFDTAWSPPIGVYEAMVEQGWAVSATYFEPVWFVGS